MSSIDASNIDPRVSSVKSESETALFGSSGQPLDSGIFYKQGYGPLKFHIGRDEVDRSNLVSLVESNGGIAVDDYSGHIISQYPLANRETFKPDLLYDSVRAGALADFSSYRVNEEDSSTAHLAAAIAAEQEPTADEIAIELIQQHAQAAAHSPVVSANKNGFTKEEDMFILEEVRKNPTRRATHKLFGEIAQRLNRHTGNSVRYRYRNHLQKQISFVYKTDENGDLLTDNRGNYIRTEALPLTVKHKFTSSDDFVLCKTVMEKAVVNSGDQSGTVTLPNKFFDALEREQPQHSRAAWRDRFRKFAKVYGIENYIRYYEECVAQGKIPEPMKDFTARRNAKDKPSRRRTPGNISSESSKVSSFDFNNLISDKKSKKHDASASSAAAEAVAAAVAASKGAKQSNLDTSIFMSEDQRNELSSLVDSSLASTSDHLLQNGNSNSIPLINRQFNGSLSISQLMAPEVLAKYFSKDFLDLPLSTILDRANNIVARGFNSNGAEELLDSLHSELGIYRSFGTELLTNCCGDLSLITKYLNLVINTGVHPPENVSGIWTKEDDRRMNSGDKESYDYLVAKHGANGIKLRKEFMRNTGSLN